MIWRRVSKSWSKWLKCFTVCVANDLKHWMAETYFDRRKSKTRVFWLLFCSQKSDRKYFTFIFYSWVIIVFKWIHMPFGEVLTQKRTKKVKTAIFDVQLPSHALKRLNDSHTLTNLFYACFNGLKLVCKSYVDSKIRC